MKHKTSDQSRRSRIYCGLYHAMNYPSEQTGILSRKSTSIAHLSDRENTAMMDNSRLLLKSLQGTEVASLQTEYVRLFDYRPVCPPFESAHRRDLVPSALIADLNALYREGEMACKKDSLADHISVEFEFMHYLTCMEASAAEVDADSYRDLQKQFFGNHILQWVPAFCHQLKERAKFSFNILGEVIHSFILAEKDRLCP